MNRREFITLFGGAAAAWPRTACAQQGKLATVGLLGSGTAAAQSQWTAAFVQRMRELGWIEGRNLTIEYRWADGQTDRLPDLASDLVRLKVDVILTHNTPPVLAAKAATSVIPIVFATSGDPVSSGIVASLARPGGNITGFSSEVPDVASKKLGLLRDIVPGFHRLAILADVGNPYAVQDERKMTEAARSVGVEVVTFEMRQAGDIEPAFETMKRSSVQAVYVLPVPLLFANRVRINTLALAAHQATMHGGREYVEAGGLMSYGPNWTDMWRRAADLVDKILHGAKPADIPVEEPTKFDLVINLTTAKALGLNIPESILLVADKLIE
jgi:putative tryptophan/tyrosine transport system substrate-binding protein